MKRLLAPFLRNESGATVIEYALIAAFISIVIVSSVGAAGTSVQALFDAATAGFGL